jgi:hypothetical protein
MPPQQLPYKRPFFSMTLTPHEIEVSSAASHAYAHGSAWDLYHYRLAQQ